MTSQVMLDQIREIELYLDVWETQDPQTSNQTEIHKPDEEPKYDTRKNSNQIVVEKPNEFVPEEKVIEETRYENVPKKEEKTALNDRTEIENIPRKNIPEYVPLERKSMEKTLQEKSYRIQEENTPEEVVEKVKLSVRPTLYEYKPEEKSPEQTKKRIQRKAIPGDYKIRKRDEKTLLEPSCSLYSLVSSRNINDDSLNFTAKNALSRNASSRGKDDKADNESVSTRSEKSFLYEQPATKHIPQSRTTSISSKKSSRSAKSTRRQNDKNKSEPSQKYIARTYEEMMRIPDVLERISFYEKTLDLCLKSDSPITDWSLFMSTRGKLPALEEGYIPLPRSDSDLECASQGSSSITFSESISLFLKKAAGSQAFSKRPTDNKSALTTSKNNSAYGSGIFGRSISRINLSRSAQMAKYDQQKSMGHRVNALSKRSPGSRRGSIKAVNPISVKPSISTPQSYRKVDVKPIKEHSSELTYMTSVLPNEDSRVLLDALNEANGDTTDAISIVMNKKHSIAA